MCIAKDCLVLAAMLVFLKGIPTWPPHAFLFKIISFLLTHIYVVKGVRALKFCSVVWFFPLSKLRTIILL